MAPPYRRAEYCEGTGVRISYLKAPLKLKQSEGVGRVLMERWVEGAKDKRSSEMLKLLKGVGGGGGEECG